MNFVQSMTSCFKKYFVQKGRASKLEYWWPQLVWMSSFLLLRISAPSDSFPPLIRFFLSVILLILIIPLFNVGIRRLHDMGKYGGAYFWTFVPFVGGFIVLYFMLCDGIKGKNQYGENPLKKRSKK